MRVAILGPLELRDEHGVPLLVSGLKRRALLATLVLRAGRTVSADRLIEELWGVHPPANAANALQAHVRRLRTMLSSVLSSVGGQPDRITTRAPGYALHLRPGETDVGDFVARVAAARLARPAEAIALLRGALAMWRGPALAGCIRGDLCAAEAGRLEELRLTTLETVFDLSLRTARHAEVIGDLERTTAANPLRERFYDQLMAALHRSSRPADALDVYTRARQRLLTELGVEPGPALRARAAAVLNVTGQRFTS